jgi:hypothetical protein
MEEPIQPDPPPAVAPQAPEPRSVQNPTPSSNIEYDRLISFFKLLVWLTAGFITICLSTAGVLFYSNMKDVREEAKVEASRVATTEARDAVVRAFDEKNINALILKAATDKVGTVTDRIIQQQVTENLRPIQQRFTQIAKISECEMRMRLGFRAGLDELTGILENTADPEIQQFGTRSLAIVSQDYDSRVSEGVKFAAGGSSMLLLDNFLLAEHRPQESLPTNVQGVVKLIRQDDDLNAVAGAFIAFRDLTGDKVKMFDIPAVESWCSQNQPKCKTQ